MAKIYNSKSQYSQLKYKVFITFMHQFIQLIRKLCHTNNFIKHANIQGKSQTAKKFEKSTLHTFNFHSKKGPNTFHKPEINATFMFKLE